MGPREPASGVSLDLRGVRGGDQQAVEDPAEELSQRLALLWAERGQHLIFDLRASLLRPVHGGPPGIGDLDVRDGGAPQ